MFVDRAIINVRAGNGGAGHVSFRRMKYEPKGGPNGGNGGKGGDVILLADEGVNTLLDFRGRPDWEAQDGGSGGKKQCTGLDGQDRVIRLPAGTLVYDNATGELIVDLAPKQRFVVCKGGGGGFGNEHYKSSTNQAPLYAHPGFPGEKRELRLELKLIADVGLVGMPNAGKSTLLAALTKATPKIADYPFTTLAPQLGVAELDPSRRLVIADIPGLIEGASEGHGLGLDFLRHIERTRVLLHLLDCMPPDGSSPADNYKTIRKELYAYSPELAEREEIIVLNKLDLIPDAKEREAAVKKLRAQLKLGREVEVFGISGAARINTRDLLEHLWKVLKRQGTAWHQHAEHLAHKPHELPVKPLKEVVIKEHGTVKIELLERESPVGPNKAGARRASGKLSRSVRGVSVEMQVAPSSGEPSVKPSKPASAKPARRAAKPKLASAKRKAKPSAKPAARKSKAKVVRKPAASRRAKRAKAGSRR
jgi:GTP-binding protein